MECVTLQDQKRRLHQPQLIFLLLLRKLLLNFLLNYEVLFLLPVDVFERKERKKKGERRKERKEERERRRRTSLIILTSAPALTRASTLSISPLVAENIIGVWGEKQEREGREREKGEKKERRGKKRVKERGWDKGELIQRYKEKRNEKKRRTFPP